ncbi:hypothetical protein RSDT_0708 [Candidatus Desulfovibrio trichonymphae]|uniref:Secreted protein n=1 Tax=Candidatus Desulfovibrio trichonymphae TaxID=1725232 RepID=A0A1J1DWH1_9BACT|nr:hypothetical protein RSDT_0708 [Candidatus Desulfovibrio trichonymphae]GHU99042.1 hypothetical protein AGMMS50248_06550 [Deltaproteobacteria bacterium]
MPAPSMGAMVLMLCIHTSAFSISHPLNASLTIAMETEHTAPLPAAYRMRPAMSIYADGKKADERGCGIHAQTCGEYWLAAVFVAQRAPYEHGQGKAEHKAADGEVNERARAVKDRYHARQRGEIEICRKGNKSV